MAKILRLIVQQLRNWNKLGILNFTAIFFSPLVLILQVLTVHHSIHREPVCMQASKIEST